MPQAATLMTKPFFTTFDLLWPRPMEIVARLTRRTHSQKVLHRLFIFV